MKMDRGLELRETLASLQQQHRALDQMIISLETGESRDQLKITRLKKQKLQLKDQIARIEDMIFPDIIA